MPEAPGAFARRSPHGATQTGRWCCGMGGYGETVPDPELKRCSCLRECSMAKNTQPPVFAHMFMNSRCLGRRRETVILLHPPLHLAGVSIYGWRGDVGKMAELSPTASPAGAAGRDSRWSASATRGDQGHLALMERAAPQSEVIRAIVWEDSPCCEVGRPPRARRAVRRTDGQGEEEMMPRTGRQH